MIAPLVVVSVFIGLLVLGVPIAYSLGIPALLYFLFFRPELATIFPLRVFAGADVYSLIALPLFITMGALMNYGGLTRRIIDFCALIPFIGRTKGGLALVNVLASMIFGGISGSSVADTASIGAVLIPAMVKRGYSKRVATGVTVASSTVGMIIPPSIPMIMYAWVSSVSVGKMFLAGAIPGILIGVLMLVISWFLGRKHDWPTEELRLSRRETLRRVGEVIPALLMPLFVVGVIVFGITTPTEAAGMGVLYAFVCGFFLYRELKLKDILKVLKETIYISASIMIIVTFSSLFGWILTVEHVPDMLSDFLFSLHLPNFAVLLLFAALLFFVGDFMDVGPAILLLTPIFLPAATRLGIDPVHFGTVLVVGLAIGLATPPVGQCLNVANKIAGLSVIETFVSAIPWLLANAIVLILVAVFPPICLWLTKFV